MKDLYSENFKLKKALEDGKTFHSKTGRIKINRLYYPKQSANPVWYSKFNTVLQRNENSPKMYKEARKTPSKESNPKWKKTLWESQCLTGNYTSGPQYGSQRVAGTAHGQCSEQRTWNKPVWLHPPIGYILHFPPTMSKTDIVEITLYEWVCGDGIPRPEGCSLS